MILFKNIRIEGEYILADAEDLRTDQKVFIRAHKSDSKDIYVSNGETVGYFVRAVWHLQHELKTKGKLPEIKEINWGM